MTQCERIQELLADGGHPALRDDPQSRQHLATCADCFDLLEALAELDGRLAALPAIDAPDALVARVLDEHGGQHEVEHEEAVASFRSGGKRRLLAVAGGVLAVAAAFALSLRMSSSGVPKAPAPAEQAQVPSPGTAEPEPTSEEEGLERAKQMADDGETRHYMGSRREAGRYAGLGTTQPGVAPEGTDDLLLNPYRGGPSRPAPARNLSAGTKEAHEQPRAELDRSRDARSMDRLLEAAVGRANVAEVSKEKSEKKKQTKPSSPSESKDRDQSGANQITDKKADKEADADMLARLEALGYAPQAQSGPTIGKLAPADAPPPPPDLRSAAGELLARYASLDGVVVQPAAGYWANTYVPGDPELRALHARLSARSRTLLAPYGGETMALDQAAERYRQPFDPPRDAALGVFLSASERGIDGPRRMLLQVGLAATPRYGGRRPAMNLAIVLDLRGALDADDATSVRALVDAFARARDLGDRFRLIVAGRPKGMIVPSASFRHGPLSVAMTKLFGADAERAKPSAEPTLSIAEAVQRAVDEVSAGDDQSAPLGSNAVILVTAHSLGNERATLERIAHAGALGGAPLSAIGVGDAVVLDELTDLSLAGQGNRRLVTLPAEAGRAVDRELSAVARVVARAVRLRIRLAPGVQLVDVLDSHRLDVAAAERVRQAEQSIDQRVARSLGIAADRGQDEEGIQIVIPSFYAGDSHVILLDVVVPKAGPVADVTARFKDLVQLGNGVARANLSLDKRALPRGPLQVSVLKNLIGRELALYLDNAADAVARADRATALRELATAKALLDSAGAALPGLSSDRELARDGRLIAEYAMLLGGAALTAQRDYLADSLRLAARLKQLPRPEWDQAGR